VYQRLSEKRIDAILGFDIPIPVRFDAAFMAIEMTIVTPPFVLDFASANLDTPLEFSDEIWADWESTKQEQFGSQWETVQVLLAELSRHGIQMLDPSPSNIRFG
jgi:hypothetical protein